jgi:hypothetical protein
VVQVRGVEGEGRCRIREVTGRRIDVAAQQVAEEVVVGGEQR